MNISDEAVEAAALALNWHNTRCAVPNASFMDEARAALEAAAPHLMAEAWDACASSLVDEYGTPLKVISNGNPYRSAGAGQ